MVYKLVFKDIENIVIIEIPLENSIKTKCDAIRWIEQNIEKEQVKIPDGDYFLSLENNNEENIYVLNVLITSEKIKII